MSDDQRTEWPIGLVAIVVLFGAVLVAGWFVAEESRRRELAEQNEVIERLKAQLSDCWGNPRPR